MATINTSLCVPKDISKYYENKKSKTNDNA